MKTRNIKSIIAFAQSRGMMAMPVVEVIRALNNMRYYRKPTTKAHVEKYPKLRLSYPQMEDFLMVLLKRKDGIVALLKGFGIDVTAVIGGSISLKYQLKNFWDREFHDVDIIIYPHTVPDRAKLRKAIETLIAAGTCKCSSRYYTVEANSFELGLPIRFRGRELPINIIIGELEDFVLPVYRRFNPPYEVFRAKERYKRPKDLIDIYKFITEK